MKLTYKVLHFFILAACLILQIAFVENLKLFSVNFDLILVTVVAISLMDGVIFGAFCGFAAGIALDLMVGGGIVGISSFAYAVSAFIAVKLIEAGFKQRILSFTFIIFLVTEINLILVSVIHYLFNFNIAISKLGLELLVRPVFNIILMFAIFPLIRIGMSREYVIGFHNKEKT